MTTESPIGFALWYYGRTAHRIYRAFRGQPDLTRCSA